ncbi:MAG: type II toxin-antitoxin system VapC family toxin [Acidobacteriota bacterium]|nr:type II toxin-antitoxin system VapC family toxin [Acidobacteriota bacterium]
MAYLEDEPSAERIADIISDAHDNGVPLMMSVVNAGEVWYIVARRTTAAEADRTIALLQQIGIKFIDADWPLTKIAAGYKVKGNISYADCYAAALAKQIKATLITGDHEFKQLEKEITINWL